MIQTISKITLYVNNQKEAKEFWTEKLGFEVKLEQPMGPNMTWLEVAPTKDAPTSFILYEKELMKMQNPSANLEHPSIILSSNQIEACRDKMIAQNVTVTELRSMPYGKMFTFHDQDGNPYLVRED